MSEYLDLWRYWQRGAREFARDDFRLHREACERLSSFLGRPITGQRILDIGCGQHYPETLLFHNEGNRVTGIDLDVVGAGFSLGRYAAMVRRNGAKRAIKSLVRQVFFDPVYFGEMDALAGRRLSHRRLDLRIADACALPFADATFDLIVSASAFEHVGDVEAAVRETRRVLKPGGLAHIDIHLFTSLSGGHHLEWTWPDRSESRRIPPWDHLRQNLYPVDYYLNRKRLGEYESIFERHMVVLAWLPGRREGAGYLTPEVRAELAEYGDEELLTRNVIVVATA